MSPSDVPPPKPGAPPSGPIGELDLHLLGEGHHRRLWEVLGPQVVGPGPAGVSAVQFALWAPMPTTCRSLAIGTTGYPSPCR